MKELDIRIRQGGDDAIAAVQELTEYLRLTAPERSLLKALAGDPDFYGLTDTEAVVVRGVLARHPASE